MSTIDENNIKIPEMLSLVKVLDRIRINPGDSGLL